MSGLTARVPARVHLAGNPSDGYGGAVLSAPFPDRWAEVRVDEADRVSVRGPERTWPSIAELAVETGRHGHAGGDRLVTAALAVLDRTLDAEVERRPGRFTWTTTIPRSVGLGGSSAIVIATMRAALGWWGVSLDDLALARAALAAETEVLGIAAGLADRTVQVWSSVVLTDVRHDVVVHRVDPAEPVTLAVVWNERAAAPSGDYHHRLRQRLAGGDAALERTMDALATLADEAARGLTEGDLDAFVSALDESLRLRCELGEVPPTALEPVESLRAAGARVNFAGSGGALVVAGGVGTPAGWAAAPLTLA